MRAGESPAPPASDWGSAKRPATPLHTLGSPDSLPTGRASSQQALDLPHGVFQATVAQLDRIQLRDPLQGCALLLADPRFINGKLGEEPLQHAPCRQLA